MTNYTKELNQYEDMIIEKHTRHPVLATLKDRNNTELEDILKQRRFLSTVAFTPFYDLAIDGLTDAEAKETARWVLREEYPTGKPSHREDLLADLMELGLTKEAILTAPRTPQTEEAIKGLWDLVSYTPEKTPEEYDTKAVVALRLAGEVLVSVEYGFILPELERRYGLKAKDSRFYWPHFMEDKKMKPIGTEGKSHADRFSVILARLVNTQEKLSLAEHSMDAALKARSSFYKQFER